MKNEKRLNDLITSYDTNKTEFDRLKKIVDKENNEIKSLMTELGLTSKDVDGRTVKLTTSVRTTVDEDKLLTILTNNNVTECVRTKQYVDMDILESMMYHKDIPEDVIKLMKECFNEKEVISIRLSDTK